MSFEIGNTTKWYWSACSSRCIRNTLCHFKHIALKMSYKLVGEPNFLRVFCEIVCPSYSKSQPHILCIIITRRPHTFHRVHTLLYFSYYMSVCVRVQSSNSGHFIVHPYCALASPVQKRAHKTTAQHTQTDKKRSHIHTAVRISNLPLKNRTHTLALGARISERVRAHVPA